MRGLEKDPLPFVVPYYNIVAMAIHAEPGLTWEMVEIVKEGKDLPFHHVTMDEGSGRNTASLDRVAGALLIHQAQGSHDTAAWPDGATPPANPVADRRLIDSPPPKRVDRVAGEHASLACWRQTIKESTNGLIGSRPARRRRPTRRSMHPTSSPCTAITTQEDEA